MVDRHVLLDSSVLINLLASGGEQDLLLVMSEGVGICSAVEAESRYLRGENPTDPMTPIVLTPLIEKGLLRQHDLQTEDEQTLYVDLALDLDDGESMTIAIAHERQLVVATDDRKARRIITERFGNSVPMLRTSDIIFNWAEQMKPSIPALQELLRRIQRIAQFRPANDDPRQAWWDGLA